ncbi:MAG: folate-binding protein [Alphaproteobacteria bacterium]|nr:folate-binding protein [Alphaproteobacteria bacterium]
MAERLFIPLVSHGIVEVAGPDARSFLQNLITQDLGTVGPRHAGYGALLTPQGRFLHDFLIVERGDSVLLECERTRIGDLVTRLERYRLRAKLTLADSSENWAVYALWGEGAAAALGLEPTPGAARSLGDGVAFVDPRLAALGGRALLPAATDAAVLTQLGFAPADAGDYDRHRLALAVPDGSRDLEPDKTVAAEGNLDALGAIAWNKGCYIGQELTTRYRHRGLVKRRLFPVAIEGPMPPPGTPVLAGGKEAGVMRSGAAGRGLALLRLEAASGSEPLTAGEARLVPLAFPFAVET